MIKNYIKTAFRNFSRHKSSFFINVIGLSTGMACTVLILLWVNDEINFDRWHAKDDRIYRVMEHQTYAGEIFTTSSTPGVLADAMKEEYPELEHAATMTWEMDNMFSVGDRFFKAQGMYVGADWFHIFSFRLLHGNADDALTSPTSLAISKSLAQKLFDTEDAVGKTVLFNKKESFNVTAVFDDVPANSTIRFDYLIPFTVFAEQNQWVKEWGNNGPRTVITLAPGTKEDEFEAKIGDFIKKRNEKSNVELFVHPFGHSYLYGRFKDGHQDGGRIDYVRMFSIIAIFILLIACINFMNLSTARSQRRSKEVGIRKAIGASRKSLVVQFIGESILISLASLILAIGMVFLALPYFNELTDKEIILDLTNPVLLGGLAAVTIFTGLIAGSYPALYLSGFEAVQVLKGSLRSSVGELIARKGLVVFQFFLSIVLIISTIVIYNQIQFTQTQNLGYEKENLIKFPIEGDLKNKIDAFQNELRNIPNVVSVSTTSHSLLGRNSNTGGVSWEGKDPETTILFEMVGTSYDFLSTMGMEIKEGRDFSKAFGSDSTKIIINEAAARVMQMEEPIGKKVDFWDGNWEIIGMVKDFHFQSMHSKIEPLIFRLDPTYNWACFIRLSPVEIPETLAQIKQLYEEFNPGYTFEYQFMDEQYAQLYQSEMRVGTLSRYFASFAVIISCLGLFGLSAFTAERRTKEIGIRKVLGATVANLAVMLSKDFTQLVVISIMLAVPVAWYFMDQWLGNFIYKIDLSIWFFVAASLLALVIAWLTVSFQSVKAALANPSRSLRNNE